jgi:hypothetical protein
MTRDRVRGRIDTRVTIWLLLEWYRSMNAAVSSLHGIS